jgi:Glycosyl hydrolases family 28
MNVNDEMHGTGLGDTPVGGKVSRRRILGQLASASSYALVGFRAAARLPFAGLIQGRPNSFDVTRFGAIPDGARLNTRAIQAAIDACFRSGGGEVVFPRGRFVTGTLLLKTGVVIHLDEGAELLGSLNTDDYQMVDPFVDGVNTPRGYTLIGAIDASQIGIQGLGTIDGRGADLQRRGGNIPAAKAFLVRCVRCKGIAFRGVSFRNSSAWTMHFFQCSDGVIEDISIRSVGLANNDGIDVDSSTRFRIDGCNIESDDDAICLKTTSAHPCTDIAVTNCILNSKCAGFKLGTESLGDFRDIFFTNSHVIHAGRSAIKILSVDGANIQRIKVENIAVDDADTPIFIRLGARLKTFRKEDTARVVGSISDVNISRVSVHRAKRVGVLLCGIPGYPMHDITLDTIDVTIEQDGLSALDSPPSPAEATSSYPENNMFGPFLPGYGMYARHIAALRATKITVTLEGDCSLPAVVLEDAEEFRLGELALNGNTRQVSAIVLRSVRNSVIQKVTLDRNRATLLSVEGVSSREIHLKELPLNSVTRLVSFADGALPGSVITD